MSEIKIKGNKNWRQFKYRDEVPARVLSSQFEHLNTEDDGSDGFIKYRGHWYHLSDFVVGAPDGWDGVMPHGFFSGVLIKVSRDCETYQIATYFY